MEAEQPEKAPAGAGSAGTRMPRSIRFHDQEWRRIELFADKRGVPAAELLRFVAPAAVDDETDGAVRDLSPLIERMFRYSYMMATNLREETIGAGRSEELEKLIDSARRLQVELVGKPPG